MVLHEVHGRQQVGPERLRPVIAHEQGERRDPGVVRRQGVGLAVLLHLDAVLDRAEIAVGLDQLVRHAALDPSGIDQGQQARLRAGGAERRVAAAEDQLLGLGEELDLADAASPQLYVVTVDRNGLVAAMRVDLALDRVDVLDRREVQAAPPDERHQEAQEVAASIQVAGHGPRLDHGGPLPVLAEAAVIALRRRDRYRQRCRPRIGTQTEICTEDIAVPRPFLHNADQIARETDKGSRHVVRLGGLNDMIVV